MVLLLFLCMNYGLGQSDEQLLAHAIEGDVSAQYNLAQKLEGGNEYQQDLNKARYWFEKAAIQGHEKSARKLADYYQKGSGVEKDPNIAKAWNAFANALSGRGFPMQQKTTNQPFEKIKDQREPIKFVEVDKKASIVRKPYSANSPTLKNKPSATGSGLNGRRDYFTIGSSKAHVIAVQGQPTSFDSMRFMFGASWVNFDSNGRVKDWFSGYNKLKARIEIDNSKYIGRDYFTVGSSKAHVIAVQGQPTSFDSMRFMFGASWVNFDSNGRVKDWFSGYNKLKAKLLPE